MDQYMRKGHKQRKGKRKRRPLNRRGKEGGGGKEYLLLGELNKGKQKGCEGRGGKGDSH